MENKKKVYVETSVISNLTARPSANIKDAARQLSTHEWWDDWSGCFDLYTSALVELESSRGDVEAAKKRLSVLKEMKSLSITQESETLAESLLQATAVPRTSYEDAVHIALAAISGMDFLLTWNCKHIANAVTMPRIYEVLRSAGYDCPLICTPDQLKGE